MRIIRTICTAALVALVWAGNVGPAAAQDGAVEITADRFVVDEGTNQATFTGNVVITQPDLTVWAQKVVVHYGDGGPSDLRDFEATGGVRIRQPEQSATADRGTYDPNTKLLRLSGNVTVTNDSGTVTGPELVVNIETGSSEFTSRGGGRVTGIFTPQGGDSQ